MMLEALESMMMQGARMVLEEKVVTDGVIKTFES